MKKAPSGSRRKCDTVRHKKTQGRQREKRRGIKALERIHTEAEFAERNFTRRDAPLVCPLCNQPITAEDLESNVHNVRVDHKDVQVHRTCPGESA